MSLDNAKSVSSTRVRTYVLANNSLAEIPSFSFTVGYVPDGMSPEQYKKLKQKENAEQSKKKFGAYGPQSFKSRSLASFQSDLEQGKAGHLMPMFNAKEKLNKGAIKQQDIPYMQRGGKWDDSDIKGAKKKAANAYDQKYNNESNQRFGIDWTGGGSQQRGGGPAAAAKTQAPPKKKGWFGFSP